MVVPVDLSDEELSQLKRLLQLDNETEAVATAVREFLRIHQLRQLKSVSGTVDFEPDWQQLESLEIGELRSPE